MEDKKEEPKDIYDLLQEIIQGVPWDVWEKLGFHGVKNVEVMRISSEHERNNRVVDTIRVHIYHDLIIHNYLEGFERIDIPWAELANHWEPYKKFLQVFASAGLEKIQGDAHGERMGI